MEIGLNWSNANRIHSLSNSLCHLYLSNVIYHYANRLENLKIVRFAGTNSSYSNLNALQGMFIVSSLIVMCHDVLDARQMNIHVVQ